MQTAELAKLIKSRRSIRVWQDKPVAEELLLQAIELATWAPNGGNQQNWYFYVILNRNTINAIADAPQALREYMSSWPEMAQAGGPPGMPRPDGGSPPPARPDALRTAPAVIVVATRKTENPMNAIIAERAKVDPKAKQIIDDLNTVASQVQSVSAAIAYLLLALHQMGLGAVWMTGPLPQCKGDVEKILKVPPDMDIIALIPVGYPGETPTKERRPVSEVCEVIK